MSGELLPSKPLDRETVRQVFQILTNFKEKGGGTFRHLIYDHLDMEPESYQELYLAGGMLLADLLSRGTHDATENEGSYE